MVDMLEHEGVVGIGALASRADAAVAIIGRGETQEVERSFLIKKMEIEFTLQPARTPDDANVDTDLISFLIFRKTTGADAIDTTAEAFDARIDDKEAHQRVIWSRNFLYREILLDDTDNISQWGQNIVWKTSKTFPKGYPMDKDETYAWSVFNADNANTYSNGAFAHLRVRYWGVYL